eukprot:12221698-Alexandrium_andersonii.AAC.1
MLKCTSRPVARSQELCAARLMATFIRTVKAGSKLQSVPSSVVAYAFRVVSLETGRVASST